VERRSTSWALAVALAECLSARAMGLACSPFNNIEADCSDNRRRKVFRRHCAWLLQSAGSPRIQRLSNARSKGPWPVGDQADLRQGVHAL